MEGKEFEPPVSVAKSRPLADEGKHLAVERGSLVRVVSSRGTEGSNPSPSSGESLVNLTFGAHPLSAHRHPPTQGVGSCIFRAPSGPIVRPAARLIVYVGSLIR